MWDQFRNLMVRYTAKSNVSLGNLARYTAKSNVNLGNLARYTAKSNVSLGNLARYTAKFPAQFSYQSAAPPCLLIAGQNRHKGTSPRVVDGSLFVGKQRGSC